jgi:hypothetical protein
MVLNPSVWGPHYWFLLHTVSHSYPTSPNQVTKRKYYDLIHNFPLFIPDEKIGNKFSRLLDKYPVTPYLTSRDSFIRWVHFIHNKINHHLGKEELSLAASLDKYNAHYKSEVIYLSERMNIKKHYLYAVLIAICFLLIFIYYE